MIPEIPRRFSGGWATGQELGLDYMNSPAFNDTVPAGTGFARNDIFPMTYNTLAQGAHLGQFELAAIYSRWTLRKPLINVVSGCPVSLAGATDVGCKAKIRAPALAITECTTKVVAVNYSEPRSWQYDNDFAWPLASHAFLVSVGLLVNKTEELGLVTGFSQTRQCAGTYYLKACNLRSAIGEYDVIVHGREADLVYPVRPSIVALTNNTAVDPSFDHPNGHPSTLGGIAFWAWRRWQTWVQMSLLNGSVIAITSEPAYMQFFANTDPLCPSYRDPQEDVIASLNELMVHFGSFASKRTAEDLEGSFDPDILTEHAVEGQLIGKESVYQVDYLWFMAATLVEIICISLILPTYRGFWRMGRPVSFSPLRLLRLSKHLFCRVSHRTPLVETLP